MFGERIEGACVWRVGAAVVMESGENNYIDQGARKMSTVSSSTGKGQGVGELLGEVILV